MRRWRGTLDISPTEDGLWDALKLGEKLKLDVVYHDKLARCRRTAHMLKPSASVETEGPRPWKMGPMFEGKEITASSLRDAQWYVENWSVFPYFGKSFRSWYTSWLNWINDLKEAPVERVGIVTHNRNIQALYSTHNGVFYPKLYNAEGPEPLSVHVYQNGYVAPWNGVSRPGIYLIRHAPTLFGT